MEIGGREVRACGFVRESSGSSPGRGGHENLCERREPSDFVSFRRAVERQRFHTLNTHRTKPRQHNNTPYKCLTLELGLYKSLRPINTIMISGAICWLLSKVTSYMIL